MYKYLLGIWRHYKGKRYEVLGVAHCSQDPKKRFVVYKQLEDSKDYEKNTVWIRPKDHKDGADPFFDYLPTQKEQKYRFRKI